MLKLAFDTLRFNLFRTIMLILVLVIAVTSLLLFRGYINYSAEGMKQSFMMQSGALQIAHKNFWDSASEVKPLLTQDDYEKLQHILDNTYGINSYMRLLTVNGLIGTSERSKFFAGEALDTLGRPELYQIVDLSTNIVLNENGIVIGSGLAAYLSVNINEYVTLLGSGQQGIALTALPISGIISTGNRSADNILGLMTLEIAHKFYSMGNGEFDRIRIDIAEFNTVDKIKKTLEISLANTEFKILDWIELNPSFVEINNLNEVLYFWMTFIFIMFIFVSVSQMLQISFIQRLTELGTLRAIGFKPKDIFILLCNETLLMALISLILGILLYFAVAFLTKFLGVSFTPPMSDTSYPLLLIIKLADLVSIGGIILITTLISCLYPAYKASSKSIIEVIRHV